MTSIFGKGYLTCFSVLSWLLLSTISTLEAATLNVNNITGQDSAGCGTLATPCKTIKYTINTRVSTDSQINIAAGTYNESFVINKKNIYLKGAGNASTFIVGTNTQPVVYIDGPARVEMADLSIQNGKSGIKGSYAYIKCANLVVQGNLDGVSVRSNSHLDFQGGSVNSNADDGISLMQNSSANVNSTVTKNGGNGISVNESSSADIEKSILSNNQGSGL